MAVKQLKSKMLKSIEKITPATTKTVTSRHVKPLHDEDLENPTKDHEKQRNEMHQVQGKPALGSIQKGIK